ncbi:transposase family protein [Streptomyces sp. NPDC055210]
MVIYPAALGLPHPLVEWVTMLVVTREGDRRCQLRPSQRAMAALMYLREHTTPAKIAAGFGVSESTAHVYTSAVIEFPDRAPGLLKVLREADADFVLLDGHARRMRQRRPLQELSLTEKTRNRALTAARTPVGRGIARLKSWRIFRRSRFSPNRMMSVAKAVFTLERQR